MLVLQVGQYEMHFGLPGPRNEWMSRQAGGSE